MAYGSKMAGIVLMAGTLPSGALFGASSGRTNFNTMLDGLHCPRAALTFVENPNQRTLLRGSAAVAEDRLVCRAVEILYEDLILFRPAGNILASRLAVCAKTANELYVSLDGIVSDSVLPRMRGIFDAIDTDGDGALDPEELVSATMHEGGDWPPGAAAQLCLDEGCMTSFTFHDFCRLVAPAHVSPRVVRASAPAAVPVTATHFETPSALGWSGRFDRMVGEFLSWEESDSISSREGRQAEVVAGCFAGARNAALLEALRLIYCENQVLRGAGDAIFRMLRPPSRRQA
jgi:hypothetical protein